MQYTYIIIFMVDILMVTFNHSFHLFNVSFLAPVKYSFVFITECYFEMKNATT